MFSQLAKLRRNEIKHKKLNEGKHQLNTASTENTHINTFARILKIIKLFNHDGLDY